MLGPGRCRAEARWRHSTYARAATRTSGFRRSLALALRFHPRADTARASVPLRTATLAPVRVVQVTDYGSPVPGAFAPMLAAALRATEERGWEALAVLPARARARPWAAALAADEPGRVRFVPAGGRLLEARWLRTLVAERKTPTILHAHFTRFDVPVAALAAARRDVQAIWHFHTVLSDQTAVRARNRLRFAVVGRAVARMLCVAPHLAEAVRARGAEAAKIVYLPNGIDTRRFRGPARAEERAAARAELGLPTDARVLLHIGRRWHLKGGDLFLDALARLHERSAIALMVRGGNISRAEAERRGLADRVVVLDEVSDVRRLHAAADVMLATSRGEGMPFAVVEALSSGLAVVATNIPGHVLPRSPAALRLVSPTPDAVAAATREALGRDAGQREREGAAAHAWAREELGLERWSERLVAIYDEVAADWARP